MTDIAVRVENLGKQYRIGGKQERYKTLHDAIADTLTNPLHRLPKPEGGGFDSAASAAASINDNLSK